LVALLFLAVLGIIIGYTLWMTVGNPANGLQAQITQINNTLSVLNITELQLIQQALEGLDAATIAQLFITVNNLQTNVTNLDARVTVLESEVTGLQTNVTDLTSRVTVLETNATAQQAQIDSLNVATHALIAQVALCNCSNSSETLIPWGASSPPIAMTVLNLITAASTGTCFGFSAPTGGPFYAITGQCSFHFVQDGAAGDGCSGQIVVVPTLPASVNLGGQTATASGHIVFTNQRTSETAIGTYFPDDLPAVSTLVVSFTFSPLSLVNDVWLSNTIFITP
jgi:hypothetical protein